MRIALFLYNKNWEVIKMKEVPIWEKSNLTLEEAAAYSGIGINIYSNLCRGKQVSRITDLRFLHE